MKKMKIKKRSGGYREIYIPSASEKTEMRKYLIELNNRKFDACVQGFVIRRNIVTQAKKHLNFATTFSFDLSNFFDTVDRKKLQGKVSDEILDKCLVDGAARQGLPTSPALANIAARDLDMAMQKIAKNIDAVYTRYADDISLSTNVFFSPGGRKEVVQKVYSAISRCGFVVNQKKTRIQKKESGRREICGIYIDEEVHISRTMRRKIRAMKHQSQFQNFTEKQRRKLQGMEEFAKLKPPKQRTENVLGKEQNNNFMGDAKKLAKKYKLQSPVDEKKIGMEIDEGKFHITNDPVYFLGMSIYTTGWTSCMDIVHSTHEVKKGVIFFQHLSGISLAFEEGDSEKTIAGVTKKVMKARVLLYHCRDGKKFSGKIYGHPSFCFLLFLEKNGYSRLENIKNKTIVGNVDRRISLPHFDFGKVEKIKFAGKEKWRMWI